MVELVWTITIALFIALGGLLAVLFCMVSHDMREDKDSDGQ